MWSDAIKKNIPNLQVRGHSASGSVIYSILSWRTALCLHEKFQTWLSSARVESLYDRQNRWAFTWRQLTRVKYWYAAKSPLLESCVITLIRSREICICSHVQKPGAGYAQKYVRTIFLTRVKRVNAPFILCTWRVEIWPGLKRLV